MEVSRTSLLMKHSGAYLIDNGAIALIIVWLALQDKLVWAGLEALCVYLFIYPLCEWFCKGRAPEKYVFGLTVINGAGGPPTLLQALIRGLTRLIEAPLWFLVIFVYAHSAHCQRVGDMLSRTYVMPSRDLARLRTKMQPTD